jgi:hypothetical protein
MSSPFRTPPSDAPALDPRELRWAAEEVAALIRQTDHGSVVGTLLQQTLRELTSLKQSAEGSIIRDYRTRMVA